MVAGQQLQPERKGRQRVFIDVRALIIGFLVGGPDDLPVGQLPPPPPELSALLLQVVSG
ncbi:hypothetical protein BN135_1887 [Cronobacter muytjensii 530]